ncbi:MAG: hypothetical protein ACKVU2_01875 [Saprospiraceae bacterium]
MKPVIRSCFFLTLFFSGQLLAQINVGHIVNGVPTLTMSDAVLSDTLDFVLDGAILQNSNAQAGTDTFGIFYYIKADGIRNGHANPSQIAVILTVNGNNLEFTSGTGCTMECRPGLHCTACDQTIYEKCKRQTCSCKPANSTHTCTASITYPSNN